MTDVRVTVAITTFNRADMLQRALASVLAQDGPPFEVVVLDNASTDHTRAIVDAFEDPRVSYRRTDTNIGASRNFRRAITLTQREYLTVLADDDVMCPGFLRQSCHELDASPGAAFSVTRVTGRDHTNATVRLEEDPLPVQLLSGLAFLDGIVRGRNWVINPSAVVMRSSTLGYAEPWDVRHSRHTDGMNLYYRLAARFDIAFVADELVEIGVHPGQGTELSYRVTGGTGQLATIAERMDAVAHLIRSDWAANARYRTWLSERLLYLGLRRSELTAELVPDLTVIPETRIEILKDEIAELVPRGARVIVADADEWGPEIVAAHVRLPFPEPVNDADAIQEIERLRRRGATYMIVGWPAFWWLDYYDGMRDYLRSTYRCLLMNSRLVAYDLRL